MITQAYEALGQAIRDAAAIEVVTWDDLSNFTRHVKVTRRGIPMWHRVYTEELVRVMPLRYALEEQTRAIEDTFAPVIAMFDGDYWNLP